MILLFVKIELLDHWKFNKSTKLLVRNGSDFCVFVSWIDERLPCKEIGEGIFDILVTVSSCFVFRNSDIFAP